MKGTAPDNTRRALRLLLLIILIAVGTALHNRSRDAPEPKAPIPTSPSPAACNDAPAADPVALARQLRGVAVAPVTPVAPRHYAVGAQETFHALDLQPATSMEVQATLVLTTPHFYVWVENGLQIDLDGLQRSVTEFDRDIFPIIREQFGSEWSPGIDNDPRISILNTRFTGAAAYFTANDEYPRVHVPTSNEREMFYVNPGMAPPGTPAYVAALAHEFQHMVHWKADPNEDTWVNEGASELAGELAGQVPIGEVDAFAREPDIPLLHWEEDRLSAHYGASYLFLSYLTTRLGRDSLRDLIAEECNGPGGVERVLEAHEPGLTFDALFADWAIANYLHDRVPADAPFSYRGLHNRVAVTTVAESYPWRGTGSVYPYGVDYISLPPSAGELQLSFQGERTTHAVPALAHSGRRFWWSNRGSNSDATLTRTFDLSHVDRATLHAWLWYDIERGWDHAYVGVSTDEGATWHLLEGAHSTTDDPTGKSYGPGYTGRSAGDGGAEPGWIEEQFDLTPFTGQRVQVRFQYVTDDSMNGAGLCVDDIRLPELGYVDDVETGEDWDARGFMRLEDSLPQRFMVHLVRLGERVEITPIELDENQGARVRIDKLAEAVLIVSELNRLSTSPAVYHYQIEPVQD